MTYRTLTPFSDGTPFASFSDAIDDCQSPGSKLRDGAATKNDDLRKPSCSGGQLRMKSNGFSVRISDTDLRLLRVFCCVARCGGFAMAEGELQCGLPSISRQIKALEIRLAVRLCRRGRSGFALTDQGRRVYAASMKLIADIEHFEGEVRALHADLSGTINVGIIDALLTDNEMRIAELIKTCKQNYPRLQFNLMTATCDIIESKMLERTLDVGIVHERRRLSSLLYRPLYRERLNLFCSEDHPLSLRAPSGLRPEDVASHDFAGYTYLGDFEGSYAGRKLRTTASVNCMEAVATLISTGCYIGFLPDHYVQSIKKLTTFRRILPETYSYAVNIELVRRREPASTLIAAFIGSLFQDEVSDVCDVPRAVLGPPPGVPPKGARAANSALT